MFQSILNINIPFTDPVIIIALVLLILLIGPVFFERIRIPSIVGLLICGAIIGPHGFNLVSSDLEFSLLGTIGLLYLMFLAGLEIDLIDFIENKLKSIFIGLASFLIPLSLGFFISNSVLGYDIYASWLIGAMLSSHTLISYPILGRLGIVNKSIVTVIVGATIIADILALVSMELITNFASEGFEIGSLLRLGLNFLILLIIVFVVGPRVSKLFLSKYEGELGVQYIFILVVVFLSALIAHLLKIEPIIGAFFSGLILNRQIIHESPLYKRIEFIGNNLFIPFFLISIGLLADFKVYVKNPSEIGPVLILTVTAIAGKYIAAFISKSSLRLSFAEGNLIFGLSVSRAASAIAIILIGFNMGIVSESVLNSTVILILTTSIISSYVTQQAGKKVLKGEGDSFIDESVVKKKYLVALANPSSMESLLDFAVLIKDNDNSVPIYPLTVVTQHGHVRDKINDNLNAIKKAIKSLHTEVSFETNSRIDNNVTNGIVRAAEEVTATTILIGWNKRAISFSILFGNVLDNLLEKTKRMVLVLKTPSTFRDVNKVQLHCPENAEYEHGFYLWLETLVSLAQKLQLKLIMNCESTHTIEQIKQFNKVKNASKYFDIKNPEGTVKVNTAVKNSPSELLIFVHSRKKSISHSRTYEHFMNRMIHTYDKNNVIVIYPEQ